MKDGEEFMDRAFLNKDTAKKQVNFLNKSTDYEWWTEELEVEE
jgi:hypothetical protein